MTEQVPPPRKPRTPAQIAAQRKATEAAKARMRERGGPTTAQKVGLAKGWERGKTKREIAEGGEPPAMAAGGAPDPPDAGGLAPKILDAPYPKGRKGPKPTVPEKPEPDGPARPVQEPPRSDEDRNQGPQRTQPSAIDKALTALKEAIGL